MLNSMKQGSKNKPTEATVNSLLHQTNCNTLELCNYNCSNSRLVPSAYDRPYCEIRSVAPDYTKVYREMTEGQFVVIAEEEEAINDEEENDILVEISSELNA